MKTGTWASYTGAQSAQLERALKAKKHTVEFQIGHHKYVVALRSSDPFAGADTYVPVDWNTSLYKPVQTNTATLKERAIRRWAPHSAEFEALDRKADSVGCEQSCLFHGTTQSATKKIFQQGFNRSFCGTSNGNRYGQGVYFSRTAEYSMDSKYSRCDACKLSHKPPCPPCHRAALDALSNRVLARLRCGSPARVCMFLPGGWGSQTASNASSCAGCSPARAASAAADCWSLTCTTARLAGFTTPPSTSYPTRRSTSPTKTPKSFQSI